MKVGITGGIGCGKSTAAGMFERRGMHRLDSDALVREQVYANAAVKSALQDRFGQKVFTSTGEVDREFLGARVFDHEAELRWLEELTHPVLFELWRAAFSLDSTHHWAVEVPLLFEKKLENWFDFTVCVACSESLQLARLEQRGLPRVLAELRISKQLPLAQKIEQADFVLWNDGSPEFLQDQVDQLISSLLVVR